jgi:hypothetical protein
MYTSGCKDSSSSIGLVWVEYDIELLIPNMTGSTVSAPMVGSGMLTASGINTNLTGNVPTIQGRYWFADNEDVPKASGIDYRYFTDGRLTCETVSSDAIRKQNEGNSVMMWRTTADTKSNHPSLASCENVDSVAVRSGQYTKLDMTYLIKNASSVAPVFTVDHSSWATVEPNYSWQTDGVGTWLLHVSLLVLPVFAVGIVKLGWGFKWVNNVANVVLAASGMFLMDQGEKMFLYALGNESYLMKPPNLRITHSCDEPEGTAKQDLDVTQKFRQSRFDHASIANYTREQ